LPRTRGFSSLCSKSIESMTQVQIRALRRIYAARLRDSRELTRDQQQNLFTAEA